MAKPQPIKQMVPMFKAEGREGAMRALTSTDINIFVLRYLKESVMNARHFLMLPCCTLLHSCLQLPGGFLHSAFNFGFEAGLNVVEIDENLIIPGALVSFVQKGLQYVELEANLKEDGSELDDDFFLLRLMDLFSKDVTKLRQLIKDRSGKLEREAEENEGNVSEDKRMEELDQDGESEGLERTKERQKEEEICRDSSGKKQIRRREGQLKSKDKKARTPIKRNLRSRIGSHNTRSKQLKK